MSLGMPFCLQRAGIIDYGNFGGANHSRDGSLSSMSLMNPNMGWGTIWGVHLLYNGNRTDWACRTSGAGDHTGAGVQINFNTSIPLKTIAIYGGVASFPQCTYVAQYYNYNVSSWVTVSTKTGSELGNQRGSSSAGGVFHFNENGQISATNWRWYMSHYVYVYQNLYLYEIETYSYINYL